VAVSRGNSETAGRLFFKVNFNGHGGFVAYYPALVTGFHGENVGSREVEGAAVGVANMEVTLGEKAHVNMHAKLGVHDRFHVGGPGKSGGINQTLDSALARADNIDLDAADLEVFGCGDWGQKRIGNGHVVPPWI
jgi:hypothetical protein